MRKISTFIPGTFPRHWEINEILRKNPHRPRVRNAEVASSILAPSTTKNPKETNEYRPETPIVGRRCDRRP